MKRTSNNLTKKERGNNNLKRLEDTMIVQNTCAF
jgi:ATP-dependent protease HslVU (ClpYQ) peptidase subunit